MTLKQQKAEYATFFFEEGVVTLNELYASVEHEEWTQYGLTIKTGVDEVYSYTIGGFTSEEFNNKVDLYLNFYELFLDKYTDSNFDAWPVDDCECFVNRKITNDIAVRLSDFVLVELLRVDKRIANRLLDHALEFALAESALSKSTDYPIITMEDLYKASALTYGLGMTDYQITSRIETQLPAYMRTRKINTSVSLGGN
jgi:hypothetical protein